MKAARSDHKQPAEQDETPGCPSPPASAAMLSAMPMIGVDRGAMIIAPMTVAVESESTPAVAMMADRDQHRPERGLLRARVAVREIQVSVSSSSVRREHRVERDH